MVLKIFVVVDISYIEKVSFVLPGVLVRGKALHVVLVMEPCFGEAWRLNPLVQSAKGCEILNIH